MTKDVDKIGCGTWLVVILLFFPLQVSARVLMFWLWWGWFVVPLGVPEIGVAHIYGLLIAVTAVRHGRRSGEEDEWLGKLSSRERFREYLFNAVYSLMFSGSSMLLGWISSQFL